MAEKFDTKIIPLGAIVEYSKPYSDEVGLTYKVIEVVYIESHCKVLLEVVKFSYQIKPTNWAWSHELNVIS
jgi:hypothetical protein